MNQATLKELFNYDSETGIFTWKKAGKGRQIGDVAGYTNNRGYICIGVNGSEFLAHRMAWIYHFSSIEEGQCIDHINGVTTDNRISNLRIGSQSQNLQNLKKATKASSTGILGAYRAKHGKFCSFIKKNKKRTYLGTFNTAEEAGAAYLEAKRRLHEFCTI